MWEHAWRWGVGSPAGSGGGRLGCLYFDMILLMIVKFLYPLHILLTQMFRVAGPWIVPRQTFGVLVLSIEEIIEKQ